jgi:hypothetical protein
MDVYQIYCNLKPGVADMQFVERVGKYLDTLEADGRLEGYRVLREFLISLERAATCPLVTQQSSPRAISLPTTTRAKRTTGANEERPVP